MTTIHIPSAWDSIDNLMTCEAGRAYVLRQLDDQSNAIPPEYEFHSSRTSGDPSCYRVYSDDSLWLANNAEDEVWSDYRDFVQDSLLKGLHWTLCWTQEEREAADYHSNPWLIDDMDKQLLLLSCDGDEDAAHALVGRARTASQGEGS